MQCKRGWVRAATALFAALMALPDASGQTLEVGTIRRIARVLGGGRDLVIDTATSRVQIRDRSTGAWRWAQPNTTLFMTDELRVMRLMDVRVEIDRPGQRGSLTFLPVLIRKDGRAVSGIYAAGGLPDTAHYAMRTDPLSPRDVAISIQRGTLIVDWTEGILYVFAVGQRFPVRGTRVVFTVLPGGNEVFVYVESGTVTITRFGTEISAGEEVHLRRGSEPARSVPDLRQAQAYRDAINYHGTEVWAQAGPFWTQPYFYIPAGILGTAAVTYTAVQLFGPDDSPAKRQGVVIISIPF